MEPQPTRRNRTYGSPRHDPERPLGETALRFVRNTFTGLPRDYELNMGDIQPITMSATDLLSQLPHHPRKSISPIKAYLRINALLEGSNQAQIKKSTKDALVQGGWYDRVSRSIANNYNPEQTLKYLDSQIRRIRAGDIFRAVVKLPEILLYERGTGNELRDGDLDLAFDGEIIPVLQQRRRKRP